MKFDYLRLMREESGDLADFLDDLPDSDWNSATLCTGWRVREVVSHMAAGHTASLTGYLALLVRCGGSVEKTSEVMARRFAAEHSPAQIAAAFRRGTSGRPKGPTALVPKAELFTDHLVHHQDIRRPLGRSRAIPEARLLAALHSLGSLSARVGSKARMRGLRLVAEDVPFRAQTGAEVRGPAEALVMALCGRADAAADLRGEGAELLRRRLAAETDQMASPIRHTSSEHDAGGVR
ncbi:maleylpyruvate isomerase family mycothiol-dependent enzyme [Streptomyces sp. ME19-01-6]|uniref:maleylpyruvate isomerase family mycothiol-dependent enzyme n=1 Tax=Streptomyces sp. ME19-01-6 TaxID=3028686 RepID=UPI0029BF4038|nr:maleylpyruvate isomerase family mycothiol-dependent enzyme [Streptomyces sp. ME19-01-6]MDX3225011.1 maleylpyruvate isomerase family mycothiol-dependent enzyme [Streptomyces sp. ME19-01-6]